MTRSRVLEAFTAALLDDDADALYDRAPCGYLTMAPDGTVVKTNHTLRTMLGADELTGRTWQELLSPAGRVLHETLLMPTLRLSGAVTEVAVDLECRGGTRLPVLLNATAERDPQGRVRLVRVAVFDATERRRYEQDLVRSAEEARAAQQAAEDAERRLSALVDTLQGSLVPRSLPTVPGLSLAGAYRPAGDGSEVGGDFYDVFATDCDEWWVVLGDVSGKGVDAAVLTALVRNGARALATSLTEPEREPALILRRLDELVERHETERFCTVSLLRLRRSATGSWAVTMASGGHPPLLLRTGPGPAKGVQAQNPPVGMGLYSGPDSAGEPVQGRFDLHAGDLAMLYTDGMSEVRVPGGLLGDEGLSVALDAIASESSSADEVAGRLLDHVLALQDGTPRDDIACLVLIAD